MAVFPTIARLKPGTRYALDLLVDGTICFRTAADTRRFNRAIGDYGADNWRGAGQAGGCPAFGGTDDQVPACLCGARNRNGKWARWSRTAWAMRPTRPPLTARPTGGPFPPPTGPRGTAPRADPALTARHSRSHRIAASTVKSHHSE